MLKRVVIISAFLFALLVVFLLYAPGYLVYAERPVGSDAVVLFAGPGQKHRLYEARRLISDGYAKYLIIPEFDVVRVSGENGELEPVAPELWRLDNKRESTASSDYRRYFESTHNEALEAEQIMARLGLRSALMVSSPYHTRRINLICSRVFHDGFSFAVVPTRTQKAYSALDWLDKENRKKMLGEYVKIIWFLMYEPFNDDSSAEAVGAPPLL